jgi:hypothetical protein
MEIFSVKWPPVWYTDQRSWLQIQRSGFDSLRYQIFWEVVGLERCPLSLVSTIEELLGRKSSGFCLENGKYGRREQPRWPRGTLYPQKLALTSPTSDGLSVGISPAGSGHGVFFSSQWSYHFLSMAVDYLMMKFGMLWLWADLKSSYFISLNNHMHQSPTCDKCTLRWNPAVWMLASCPFVHVGRDRRQMAWEEPLLLIQLGFGT